VKPFLLAGGSMVILPGFDAGEVIRTIDRHRVTYLTGVPAMYKMILAETQALALASRRSRHGHGRPPRRPPPRAPDGPARGRR
jgi:acyl-CoA synthetase (AMP-forming)/AMP-acid ligase II